MVGSAIAALVLLATVVAMSGGGDDGRATTTVTSTTATSISDITSSTAPTASTRPTVTSTPTSTSRSSTTTAPLSSTPAVAIRHGPPTRPDVALTFDAGSDVGYAAAILDTLRANGVTASFGITGEWAEANPALVRRMAAEGHQLVNHSWDHPSFTGYSTGEPALSRSARLDQLARAEAAIMAASGRSARPWFRPPYADEDASVRADVGSVGYRYEALWTVDSLGWKGLDPSAITARCLASAEPGAIYLLHVGSASADAAALQPIIDGLRARGLGFVSLDDLIVG